MRPAALQPILQQAERLITFGLADRARIGPHELRRIASSAAPNSLLVIHPERIPASALAPMLTRGGKPGFVVADMADVDDFEPIPEIVLPSSGVYLVTDPDRGDHLRSWSPNEALPNILEAQRTPLTLTEGIHWLLQQPDTLHRNHCFMTIGSRLRHHNGHLDTRTPAIWISNGTGRDGAANRNAPKIGWCWAGNRHTWLGIASASQRLPLTMREPAPETP